MTRRDDIVNEQTHLFHRETSPPSTTRLTTSEWLGGSIQSVRINCCYVVFCAAIATWCILLACYSVAMWYRHGPQLNPLWFLVSDTAIMIFIIAETIADMIVLGWREYWAEPWHYFDFFICVVCTATVMLDLTSYFSPTLFDDYVSMTLLISRYGGRGLRVVWMLRMTQKAKTQADTVDETAIVLPGHSYGTPSYGTA